MYVHLDQGSTQLSDLFQMQSKLPATLKVSFSDHPSITMKLKSAMITTVLPSSLLSFGAPLPRKACFEDSCRSSLAGRGKNKGEDSATVTIEMCGDSGSLTMIEAEELEKRCACLGLTVEFLMWSVTKTEESRMQPKGSTS